MFKKLCLPLNKNKEIQVEDSVKEYSKFFTWIQEFTKKIVVITFILFVISQIFSIIMILVAYIQTKQLLYMDTFITESHTTFREVIGGYIVKAAVENAIKISGSIIEKYLNYRLAKDYGIDVTSTDDSENISDDEEDPGNQGEVEELPVEELEAAGVVKKDNVIFTKNKEVL